MFDDAVMRLLPERERLRLKGERREGEARPAQHYFTEPAQRGPAHHTKGPTDDRQPRARARNEQARPQRG